MVGRPSGFMVSWLGPGSTLWDTISSRLLRTRWLGSGVTLCISLHLRVAHFLIQRIASLLILAVGLTPPSPIGLLFALHKSTMKELSSRFSRPREVRTISNSQQALSSISARSRHNETLLRAKGAGFPRSGPFSFATSANLRTAGGIVVDARRCEP